MYTHMLYTPFRLAEIKYTQKLLERTPTKQKI